MTIETKLKNLIIKNLRIILMIFNNKKLTGPKNTKHWVSNPGP